MFSLFLLLASGGGHLGHTSDYYAHFVATAFTTPSRHTPKFSRTLGWRSTYPKIAGNGPNNIVPNYDDCRVGMAVDSENENSTSQEFSTSSTTNSRRRRKRKDGKTFAPQTPATDSAVVDAGDKPTAAPTSEIATDEKPTMPPKNEVVVMQVRDIRDVLSESEGTPASSSPLSFLAASQDDDEELEDDEEWEYYDDDEELAEDEEWEYYYEDDESADTPSAEAPKIVGKSQDDSMERLLADARKMRASSSGNLDNKTDMIEGQSISENEQSSMSDTVFEVISTIVTVDFFVVIGLLIWFLAGIFCSSVLGNDAVQIAFNNNFERVTQPALGILMIGSVAGALGGKEEKE